MASVGSSKDRLTLNLNPMLDIFSILITFLLMSFSSDPLNHDIDAGIELPQSTTTVALDEVPTIIVNKTDVIVNEKKVAVIIDGDVPEKDRSQGAVYPVFQELEKLAEVNKRVARARPVDPNGIDTSGTLTMEMDKGHRFKLMKRIMLAGQQAEFVTFKLMVQKELN